MTAADELVLLLEITETLIEYDHEMVVIERKPPKVKKPDGSFTRAPGAPATLPAQKLFFSGVTGDDRREVTVNGELIVADYILVGMPAADFEEHDEFAVWGRRFRIVEEHRPNAYERKAWCMEIK